MPTVTLHSGLFNSKTTTEPVTKVPIHAHQATNSALPKPMSVNILFILGDDERSHACTFTSGITSPQCCVKSGRSHGWRWRCFSAV